MKRFILASVAVAFAVVLGSANVEATPPHHGSVHVVPHGHVVVHPYHSLYVHGHSIDVPIRVRGYVGWSSRCWFPTFHTYGYYCGADQAWYYWYAPLNVYLPTTYLSIYPPTPIGVAPVGTVAVTPGLPALPPGASYVPGPISAP